MTDLERVRKGLIEDGVHSSTTDGRGSRLVSYCRYDGEKWPCSTVSDLDAHLKEDAERDQRNQEWIERFQALSAELALTHANWDDDVDDR